MTPFLLSFALLLDPAAVQPVRTSHPPSIDGRIDEAEWGEAAASSAFVQKFPDEAAAPSEPTRLRILYDDQAIYVAVECEQRSAPVVARLTRRDRDVNADRVEIDLDTRRDGKSAFHFGVSAAGVLVDGLRYDDTELDLDWDETWEGRARVREGGWSAELRIPLRILRFPALPSASWGLEVRRYIAARQEIDEWAFIPRSAAGEVSHYGVLGPLEGLHRGGALEVVPFVLTRLRRRDPVADTLASGTDFSASAGADGRWHIAEDLTLDASVLPDFAQVEADQVVLNLTTYETFFPEKRRFFLEGLDTFATPVSVLYTRRIGRQPEPPALGEGEALVDLPEPSAIWAAAKLVGQLGGRMTVGALAAVTGPNQVTVQDAGGMRHSRLADPATLHSALRLKRDLGDNAHVGAMATAAVRLDAPDDALHDAFVGGLDARWRSPSGDYVLSGMALVSTLARGGPVARPDGTTVSAGDAAPGVLVHAAKEGGHWLFDATYEGYTPKLDIDDLGYLTRANLHSFSAVGEFKDTSAGSLLLESAYRFEFFHRRNFDWLELADLYQINASGTLRGFWEYFVEVHYRAAHFDDREVGDGTALERAGLLGLELNLRSDPRRRVVGSLGTQNQRLSNGWNFSLDGSLTLRALPQLDVELLPSATYTTGEPRYVGLPAAGGGPLFGRQRAASVGATLRATYTFTPRLTLQAYAQVFLAAVHYDGFTTSSARVIGLEELAAAPAPAENPDAQEAVINLNVVLRWEWRPGSTLFLVYSRAQSPAAGVAAGEDARLDLGAALRGAAADVFLLKLSIWLG